MIVVAAATAAADAEEDGAVAAPASTAWVDAMPEHERH